MTDEEKKELYKMLPRVPKKFEDWAKMRFDGRRTFFFTRKQGNLHVECCHCGSKFVKEDTEKVEEFLHEPKGAYVKCPKCKAIGKLVSKKNRKNSISIDVDLWYGQKLKNGGWILRFFRPILSAVPGKEKSYEVFELSERMRYWFPAGMKKKLYKEFYHPWGWYGGEWNSTYCFSTMGLVDNRPSRGAIHPDTYENMKKTVMEYSMSKELMRDSEFWFLTLADWQQAYISNKWFEALYKMGLWWIIYEKLYYGLGIRFNGRAKNPWDYLGIEKHRLNDLRQTEDCKQVHALRVYRFERKHGEIKDIAEQIISYRLSGKDMDFIAEYTTLRKLSNYVEKQKAKDKAEVVKEWKDYIRIKEELGYDMTDSIILFPKKFKDAHDKAVIEKNEIAADKRRKEAEEMFKAISVRFKGADKVYHYEKGAFLIRPAKNASEIVEEGRMLHHCVGGDNYLRSHAEKKSIILFLRTVKEPDTPYITVEVEPNGEIAQWYGIHDSKPDEKKIDRWLGRYVKTLDHEQLRREAKRKIKTAS